MNGNVMQNAIRVNMRGFLPNSYKRFVLCENGTGSDEFTVTLIHGEFVEHTVVYKGKMTEAHDEHGINWWVGDFSEVTADGDYYITAGGVDSRQFVIYKNAYDICQRTMLEYYTYQRCGHPLGWNGRCHTDDGYIAETGEHVDLSGGYHQSCDLRKSPGGVSIGVLGMMRYAVTDNSEWGDMLVTDEVKWACDYYVKNIQENGVMYNTMNDPFGWSGRIFYKSAAPSSGQWCASSILALGYLYLKERDLERAEKYLNAAIRSYDYLVSDRRPNALYRHPKVAQRGFDPDFFYDLCQKNSTADNFYRIMVDCDLYRATSDERYKQDIVATLPSVLDKLLDGDLAYVANEVFFEGGTVGGACNYSWSPAYPTALTDAYEIVGDVFGLKEKIRAAADAMLKNAGISVWGEVKYIRSEADLSRKADMPKPSQPDYTQMEKYKNILVSYGSQGNQKYYLIDNGQISPHCTVLGVFLAKASKICRDKKYSDFAQAALDLMLGVNPQDSSHIRSIGYNHSMHKAFGQFFPSTPFIPGAVPIGYKTVNAYDAFAEYDMPCVGNMMHLITELCSL